uniref:Uncharacterized protein n=1 Tax=viral metagenome TaxID=1070528 RepID=A0A6M3IFI7_9ZZZZ
MLENINYDLLEKIAEDPEYVQKKYIEASELGWRIPSVIIRDVELLEKAGFITITRGWPVRRTIEITFTGHVVLAWRRAHA